MIRLRNALTVCALTLVTGISFAYGENASNPLAAVSNTDIRYQFFDLDGSDRNDYWIDGAYMVTPALKLKYEVHYWDTDVTGSGESDWESFHIKADVVQVIEFKYHVAEVCHDKDDKVTRNSIRQDSGKLGIVRLPGN